MTRMLSGSLVSPMRREGVALCGTRVAFNGTSVKRKGKPLPVEELRQITADWLREAIAIDGESPELIADRAGIAKSTIYRLLGQEVQPEEATIAALRGVLKHPYPEISPIKSDALPGAPPGRRSIGKGAPTPSGHDRASSDVEERKTASVSVREGEPGYAPVNSGSFDETTVGFLQMIVEAVGSAVRKVIESNELDLTRDGKRAIALWLKETARYFRAHRADVSDLYEMADQLLKEADR